MRKTRDILLVLIGFFFSMAIQAQQFEILRVELSNQKVVVHYDLTDTIKGRTYTINVYASNDNFLNPVQKIAGDVGLEVKPGNNKSFMWDAKSELGADFNGGVSLEIRGRLHIPFVHFNGFDEYKAIKRLKHYQITWSGGTPNNVLNFDLYQGDKKITTIPNVANVGHHKLMLPREVKPGKDYRFKISDTKNKDEVVYTGMFIVKRKTPLLLKIFPLLALGYVAYTLGVAGGDNSPSEIPNPISPN